MTEPPAVPPLLLRREAVAGGWSDDELARAVRAGDLARLRRGAYVDAVLPAEPAAHHALLVRATVAGLRRPAVVSHQSAAVLLGLPLWDVPLGRVHVTRPPGSWGDRSGVLSCHVARMRADEVVEVGGLRVTGPVRTLLDLARSLPHEATVVALDAALHRGFVSHEEAHPALRHRGVTRRAQRRPGRGRGGRAQRERR